MSGGTSRGGGPSGTMLRMGCVFAGVSVLVLDTAPDLEICVALVASLLSWCEE